ncbi:Tripeptidyl-peptidase 2 [Halotydeus destructor]|nr:Tripeptidyl-peptidase 2 [Halotydeus destructor]
MSSVPSAEPFPLWALLPKKETTALAFLTKYPTYDGRGVKVAIFDSGVDPGAPGLQLTTDGKPKIIEMMDATGAGDVDTSVVVEVDKDDQTITTLTGRKLTVPSSWVNPSGKYHLGVKNGYELYTKALRDRISKEYMDKHFTPEQKRLQADAILKLEAFNSKANPNGLSNEERLIKEELQAAVDNLAAFEKKLCDLGTTYDCIVFHDGKDWQVAISEGDDLASVQLLTPFSRSHQFRQLTSRDKLNISVNVHEEGNLLEIVSIPTSHGTHVASIATANFPDCPEKNGVAPGAQVVSICIGDGRLGSMEVAPALIRAANKVAQLGVDVINMSYGEHSHWTGGKVMDALQELVNKYNVVYCGSAGNRGPALSTIGTPPTCETSAIMSIGAYVSPEMMAAEYSMRQKLPGQQYTWTSRGPTLDGDHGVSICAPGGAITSVPQYTLKSAQLMNGTSMASPNAAGCVSLVLSGLKQEGIPYSTYSLRRAVEATAAKVPGYDPLAMGHGLIQVSSAFEHLQQHRNLAERDVRFHVTVNSRKKGIYLRHVSQTTRATAHSITVDPVLLNDQERTPEDKLAFEMNFAITCDVPWVTIPSHLSMSYTSRNFAVQVDPTGLAPGLHTGFIRAHDVTNVTKGAVFQVPINVLKTDDLCEANNYQLTRTVSLKPGQLVRHFIAPPLGTSSLVVKFKNVSEKEPSHFILHAIQLQPQASCRTTEVEKFFALDPCAEVSHGLYLHTNRTVEVCLGKWWSSLGQADLEYTIELHGLRPSQDSVIMQASETIHRIELVNSMNGKFEALSPKVDLKTLVVPLRPVESKIRPLGARDTSLDGQRRTYENVLTYNLTIGKSGTEVCFFCPMLSDTLYESEFNSQMWMLFDTNKRHLLTGDAYPERYTTKLDKGDYVLKFHVSHDSSAALEKLNELVVCMTQKLSASVALDVYNSHKEALIDGKKFGDKTLKPNGTCGVFFTSLAADKLPKGLPVPVGSYFSGSVSFTKDEVRKKLEAFPFKYVIDTEAAKKSGSKGSGSPVSGSADAPSAGQIEGAETSEEQFAEALKDLKVTWLAKMSGKSSQDLFAELSEAFEKKKKATAPSGHERAAPNDPASNLSASTLGSSSAPSSSSSSPSLADDKRCALLLSMIQSIENEPTRSEANLLLIIKFADEIIDKVNVNELIGSLVAAKLDKKENGGNGSSIFKNLEKNKNQLVEALCTKGMALVDLLTANDGQEKNATKIAADFTIDQVDEIYFVLLKLSNKDDKIIYDNVKIMQFIEKHSRLRGQHNRLVKLLLKQQENGAIGGQSTKTWTMDNEKKLADTLDQAGLAHAAQMVKRTLHVKFPKTYRLF